MKILSATVTSMGLFTKDKPPMPGGPSGKLKRRVAALGTGELHGWANQCLYETGRRLHDYAEGDDSGLKDAIAASDALSAVLGELSQRGRF